MDLYLNKLFPADFSKKIEEDFPFSWFESENHPGLYTYSYINAYKRFSIISTMLDYIAPPDKSLAWQKLRTEFEREEDTVIFEDVKTSWYFDLALIEKVIAFLNDYSSLLLKYCNGDEFFTITPEQASFLRREGHPELVDTWQLKTGQYIDTIFNRNAQAQALIYFFELAKELKTELVQI